MLEAAYFIDAKEMERAQSILEEVIDQDFSLDLEKDTMMLAYSLLGILKER